MHYTILDNQGNVLRSSEDLHDATAALQEMSAQTDEDLFLLRYDDTGQPVGDAFTATQLADAVTGDLIVMWTAESIVGPLTAMGLGGGLTAFGRTYAAASHPTLTRRRAVGAGEEAVKLSFSYHRDPTPA